MATGFDTENDIGNPTTTDNSLSAYLITKKALPPKQVVRNAFNAGLRATESRRAYWLEIYKAWYGVMKDRNRNTRQANFHFHKLFQILELEAARFVSAYWSHDPFTGVIPSNAASVEPAKAMEEVQQYYYEHCPVFYLSRLRGTKFASMYGCGYTVPSWRTITRKVKKLLPITVYGYSVPGVVQQVEEEETVYDGLWYDVYSPSDVFPSPNAVTHHGLPWVCLRDFAMAGDLLSAAERGIGGYDLNWVKKIPCNGYGQNDRDLVAKLEALGFSGPEADPELIHLIHYFSRDRWLTLANDEVIIRDCENPFWHGEIPVIQNVKTIDPESYYPIGTLQPLMAAQKLFNVFVNSAVNTTLASTWPMWKYRSHINPNNLVSFPNNRIPVRSMDDVDVIKMPEMKQDLLAMKGFLDAYFEEVTGYYGAQKGYSAQDATATRDTLFTQQGDKRIGYDTTTFEQLTLIPEAKQSSKLIQQFMPEGMELRIQGPGGPQFQRYNPADVRGEFEFRVSGASGAMKHDLMQQQMIDFYNVSSQATQLVRLPNGVMIPVPVLDQRAALKEIYEGFGKKDTDTLLYRPELFGMPVQNQLLSPTGGGAAFPGASALTVDPRTGSMMNPDMAGRMKPTPPPGAGTARPTQPTTERGLQAKMRSQTQTKARKFV